jgi:hypothetical protein
MGTNRALDFGSQEKVAILEGGKQSLSGCMETPSL